MAQQRVSDTTAEEELHRATDRALKKYRDACQPAWDRLQKARRAAWRQYDKDVAQFQKVCDREIARASRAYTRATRNNGRR